MVKIYEINEYIYIFRGITYILFAIGLIALTFVFVKDFIECRKMTNLLKSLGMILLSCFFLWLFSGGYFDEYREIRNYKEQIASGNGKIATGEMKNFEKKISRSVIYSFTVDNVNFELRCSPLIQFKEFFQPDKTLRENGQMLKVYYVETDEEYYETGNVIIRIENCIEK